MSTRRRRTAITIAAALAIGALGFALHQRAMTNERLKRERALTDLRIDVHNHVSMRDVELREEILRTPIERGASGCPLNPLWRRFRINKSTTE